MKRTFILLGIFLSLSLLAFQTDVNPEVEDQEMVFHSIVLKGNYEVYLSQGSVSHLEIKGNRKSVETRVDDGVLYVEGSGKIWKGGDAVLYIRVSELRSLVSAGAIELHTKGLISGKELDLDLAGASEVSLDLDYRKLRMETAGATEVDLRGSALYADFKTVGASEINAIEFKVRSLGIETAGASELEVYVTDEMKVKARGASEIRYRGNPPNIIRDLKGASSLEPI
jgi:hypothetical protein